MTMVALQQPRTLIHRVDGRDLRVLVDTPYVYLSRDDVEAIASVPPWSTGDTLIPAADEHSIEISGVTFIPIDAAVDRVHADSTDPAAAGKFLFWLDEHRPTFTDASVLELAHQPAPFTTAHTVAAAAALIAAELGISLGRDRLFDHMDSIGWIERNDSTSPWIITALPHNNDWLTFRAVLVGPRRSGKARPYPQIHVTPAGLAQLTESFRNLRPAPQLRALPTPTLFD